MYNGVYFSPNALAPPDEATAQVAAVLAVYLLETRQPQAPAAPAEVGAAKSA